MLSVIFFSVTYKLFMLSVIMLSVVMLSVVMLNVIMLNVAAPTKPSNIFLPKRDKISVLSGFTDL
jgi:hypothetical protein